MAATSKSVAAAALLVATLLLAAADAQSPAAAPGSSSMAFSPAGSDDCVNNLLNMSDCLGYVEEGSKLSKPDKGCCPELAGLIESQPICLCKLLSDPEKIIGVKIELDKALKLPNVCKIDSPSASLCSAVGIPVGAIGAPVGAPVASGGPSPSATADAMSPFGAASSPTVGKGDSNGASTMALFDGLMTAMVFATLLF